MRKFANTHKILVNYPPDSAVPLKTPYFVGGRERRYAGTFLKCITYLLSPKTNILAHH